MVQRDTRFQQQMQDILIRWKLIYNQAKYICHEHQIKDKQYGVQWRLDYFEELKKEAAAVVAVVGSEEQRAQFEEIRAKTDLVLKKPGDNKTYTLQEYIMNGDLDLFQMLNRMIAETYQNQKKLVEKYQVMEMMNNIHSLALVEVSVTYLRILLKHKDIGTFLKESPSTRAEIIDYKIQESNCPFNVAIFSALAI